jgi:hypothetical protein
LINFGWLGIPLFAISVGLALRMVDAAGNRSAATRGRGGVQLVDVVYPLLLGQVFLFTRGDFLSPWAFTSGMLLAMLPLLAGEAIARMARRCRASFAAGRRS